jgi:hypothetical protein
VCRSRRLGSSLPCFWVSPFVGLTSRMPCVASITPSHRAGTNRASQVLNILSTRIPRSKVDPGRPSRTSPFRSVCVGFWHVKTIAICSKRDNGAVSSFGECGLPYGLRVSLCTLQLTCSAFASAVAVATLGTGGWLSLTRQGLSPCKKMPSLAWRTNAHDDLRRLSNAKPASGRS